MKIPTITYTILIELIVYKKFTFIYKHLLIFKHTIYNIRLDSIFNINTDISYKISYIWTKKKKIKSRFTCEIYKSLMEFKENG